LAVFIQSHAVSTEYNILICLIPYITLNTSCYPFKTWHEESEVKNFTGTDFCITVRVKGFQYEYHRLILYSDIIAFFI
jgi:hypothetical protein